MEADPPTVNKTASFRLLFLHGVSVPSQIILQPIVDTILMNDAKMSQSIIGEIEYFGFPIICLHEIVCYDGDETMKIIVHAIQDLLLRYLIELTAFIEY